MAERAAGQAKPEGAGSAAEQGAKVTGAECSCLQGIWEAGRVAIAPWLRQRTSLVHQLTGSSASCKSSSEEESSLYEAIAWQDEKAALWMLLQPQVPGLNEVDDEECTVLHRAIDLQLPAVANAILARADFHKLNAADVHGRTALHYAAWRGSLWITSSIVSRLDFEMLGALDEDGYTALDTAQYFGYEVVAEALEDAAAA